MNNEEILAAFEISFNLVKIEIAKQVTGYVEVSDGAAVREDLKILYASRKDIYQKVIEGGDFTYLGRRFHLEVDYHVLQKKAIISTYEIVNDPVIYNQFIKHIVRPCTINVGVHEFDYLAMMKFQEQNSYMHTQTFIENWMPSYKSKIEIYLEEQYSGV